MLENNSDISFWDAIREHGALEICEAMLINERFPWLSDLDEETVEKLCWVEESIVIEIFKNMFEKKSFLIDSLNEAKKSKKLEGCFFKREGSRVLFDCRFIQSVKWNLLLSEDELLDSGVDFESFIEC